jgi:predicted nuclease with TOPRIM domain
MSDEAVLTALARLAAQVDQLRVELSQRLDRQQDVLTALRDDLGVNFGQAEHIREATKHARDEVRALADVVSGMQRQIQRLQAQVRELRGEA